VHRAVGRPEGQQARGLQHQQTVLRGLDSSNWRGAMRAQPRPGAQPGARRSISHARGCRRRCRSCVRWRRV
jgi:hypothetical protein